MPVAPRTSTVPSDPVSDCRWRSGSHDDMPGLTPPAIRSGSAPSGRASFIVAGTAIRSASVPYGACT
jgi:hypothetical protein